MQTEIVTNIRYPESRKRFFLNFVLSLWFEKRVEEVKKEGKPARIKRYAEMDPFEMVVEPPLVFNKAKQEFKSCIVDRQAGTLLVDQSVPQVTFQTFIDRSEVSDKINENGSYSADVANIVKEGITFSAISAIIGQSSKLSDDPIFYLAKVKDSDDYIILFDHKENDPQFDDMVSWIFRDYRFENITMETYEEGDSEFPTGKGEDLSSLYCGKITLSDLLLVEETIAFPFINLKQLNLIVGDTPIEPEIKNPSLTDKDGNPIEDGSTITDNQPTFSGDGMKPGSTVTITDNGEKLGEATVDDDGKWTFKPDSPLEDGEHKFGITGTDSDGNPVTGEVTVNIDTSGSGGDEQDEEDKALEDPTEGGKYGGPGMAGFGLTVESSKDITGITKTLSDIPKVTIPFPYVDKGSID